MRARCLYAQERRSALLKARVEARARGEKAAQGVIDKAKLKFNLMGMEGNAAAAAAAGGGIRFSIDEEEAAQVIYLPHDTYTVEPFSGRLNLPYG